MKKILIVGGVAGGASAAARLRRLDEEAEIIVFEKGEFISFANCGLPYHIGENIKDRSKLLLQTPEAMKNRFNIDVRVFSEVIGVNPEEKKVKVISKDRGEYEESYDSLILSPGAKPIRPNIEGIDSERIFTLRNIPDMDKIKARVDKGLIKKAIVIGGGYIGVEAAENLVERNVDTVLVEAAPHILAPFDSEMVAIAEKELQDNGVSLILSNGVKEFKDYEDKIEVVLNSGKVVTGNMVILAIGVTPDVAFLKNSGIAFGQKGHILVNEYMETNKEGIYAVGDAIEVKDLISGNNTAIPLAGPANRQGRVVANNIAGMKSSYRGTLGSAIIKVFNLTGASTGNNERTLKNNGVKYNKIYIHPNSHAAYYPGAVPMSIKLLYEDEGKILGAQAFGYDGVDKVIDVLATTIKLNGTMADLADLELTYAPPYNSAKSPANMLGFVSENIFSGLMDVITLDDLNNFNSKGAVLVDVREKIEWDNGHIEGAIHIPLNELRSRKSQLPIDKEVWIYCQVGVRGHIASRILKSLGYKVKNLTGGYKTYTQSKFIPKEYIDKVVEADIVENKNVKNHMEPLRVKECDATGLCCPGPLMTVKVYIDDINSGEVLRVKASDPGFYEDIKAWCKRTGNELLSLENNKGEIIAMIKKREEHQEIAVSSEVDNHVNLFI